MNKIFEYIEDHIEDTIDLLFKMVAQPSISAQNIGFDKAPGLMIDILNDHGFDSQIIPASPNGHPSVIGLNLGNYDKTLLFYTHYDVQPPEPLDLWESEPFRPERRGDKLFGRGISDDKGNIAARLAAVRAFSEIDGKLPCGVKFFMEGEEEIGSKNLSGLVKNNMHLLAADACIWEGGGRNIANSPFIYLGLKGILNIKMSVRKLGVDAHSSYAPVLPSAVDRLIQALASIKDSKGNLLIEGLNDDIVPLTPEQEISLVSLPDETEGWRETFGVKELVDQNESKNDLKIKLFQDTTATINGIEAGYNGPGVKTVLPSYAQCKMDFRLVPDQNPINIFKCLRKHLDENDFQDVEIEYLSGVFPYRTDMKSKWVELVKETAYSVYGLEPVVTPNMPGTGPMYEFGHVLGIPIASAGVDHPSHRIHAPNENILVEDLVLGAKHIALIMKNFGLQKNKKWK